MMTVDSGSGSWRQAEILEDLCRRLDEAEREAIAWEALARPPEAAVEAAAAARV